MLETIGLARKGEGAVHWTAILLSWMLLTLSSGSCLVAAETQYIASGRSPLTVRSGPGVEYGVVSRLSHGTSVAVYEYWGQWAKIAAPTGHITGWVPRSYLSSAPPEALAERADMNPEQEQRRFTRLQRKGVIVPQRSGISGVVWLSINPFIWHRLTPHQQENFLRRAQRHFGGTIVEIHDRRNDTLLARLTAAGNVEFSVSVSDPTAPGSNPESTTSLPAPDAPTPQLVPR